MTRNKIVVHYQSPLIWCNKAHIGSSSLALSRYARKLSKIIFFIQSYPIARVINLANDYFNIVVICQPPVACHCHDPVQISWRNCYHTLKQTVEKIEAIMKCTSRGHNENQCLFEKWYRSSLMKNPTLILTKLVWPVIISVLQVLVYLRKVHSTMVNYASLRYITFSRY